ncbi:Putative P-loop containing nucleoside triphosphate hydrolase [Septoria linicola]|uniref:P-loop containing nucleoside triphosphate hydrolase n=1 Tax=Septoria linicola TaxID=215465 RepID=A0A9Q9AQJ1_9PEZI|nr:putative P-loop containing nucleoside triphosphate hydrolase [Septoria linicola]USW50383.1 Putative P-loop containing nucleoside triphosphate hydrolase [Septoria linicola]
MSARSSRVLLVAGAVSYDYLVYPMTSTDGLSHLSLDDDSADASQLVIRTGAADLVAQLLTAAQPQWGFEVLGPQLLGPTSHSLKHNASSVVDLGHTKDSGPALRVVRKRKIGRSPVWHQPSVEQTSASAGSTVIISGSGEALQDVEPALDFLQRVRPRHIIHYMTRPLATGPLWDIIRNGPLTRDGIPDPDHLAVIIDAEDLRAEGISLSRSLSWESTAEDFVRNLGSNGRLDTLVTCPNLIVRFGNQGIIHHRGRDATDPKLYFHPRHVEKNNNNGGHMIELSSAFTAGFALGFAESSPPNTEKGIRLGISVARDMDLAGFVTTADDSIPNYPIKQIIEQLAAEKRFSSVSIPSGRISSGDSWRIFDAVTGDPAEVARQVVTLGAEKTLARCPAQKFGDLLSVERSEQESLRAVVDAVQERLTFETSQPTSIGILGPPGSGKKFVAANLATHFSRNAKVKQLTFNGRLLRLEDLIALCHTIRDNTASGVLTIVRFENFEAILEPKNELLNDFLVMMRDGRFTDRGHVRSLGHPLLFFLVNQEPPSFQMDGTPTAAESRERRVIDESQLLDSVHGVVRILGPNQTGQQDKMFPIRRALMLRQMLKQKFPHLENNDTIKIDDAVLHALLLVPSFKHGLRSLDKILSTSRLSHKTKFDVSALPPEEQIQLHVDGRIFMSFLRSPKLPPQLRERLAQGLFVAYKKKRVEMARTPTEKAELESDPSMYDWDELAGELKESTRSQADDIPRKLRAVNCFMLDQDRSEPLIHVPEFTVEELDMLSEMEHERFNAERLQRQWRMGPRSSGKRITPFLVPWRDLTQDWKDVDRVMVECVPKVLATAGWKIYRMQEDE